MPVTIGNVRLGGWPGGGATAPIDFTNEEGKHRRREVVAHYGKVSRVQLPLAVLAFLSGAATVGLAIPNPDFPFLFPVPGVSFFPLINGLVVLGASLCMRYIGRTNLDNEIPHCVRVCVELTNRLIIMSIATSVLTAVFSGVGVSYCFHGDAKFRDKCLPVREVKIGLAIVGIFLAVLLLPISIAWLVFFCTNGHSLGFVNRDQLGETRMVVLSPNQGQPIPGGGVGGGYPAGGMVNPPYGQMPGYGYAASNPGGGSGGLQGYGVSPAGYTYSTQTAGPN